MPAVFESRDFIAAGGLMSYGGSLTDSYRLTGVYTGRIAEFGELIVSTLTRPEVVRVTRLMAAECAAEQPRLSAVFYTAGRGEMLKRVAVFLNGLTERGVLSIEELQEAKAEARADNAEPWRLRLERLRGKVGNDGAEEFRPRRFLISWKLRSAAVVRALATACLP
jgi:AefR-like transcriptional repressor, C-terminal domain